ncbi:hypothetical protein [Cellulomonas sp. Y8]|uniref:hypothetical protein n=1 Tax=Cellulomonas sp. Y8 TaxID=2591145 RepID=UPI003D71F948
MWRGWRVGWGGTERQAWRARSGQATSGRPSVREYEYSRWGTYHFADRDGIGVDRTVATWTGFAGQFPSPWRETFASVETCPDELLFTTTVVSDRTQRFPDEYVCSARDSVTSPNTALVSRQFGGQQLPETPAGRRSSVV